ncbi:hypothetical protein VaNZ11_005861, partial [Volvox africanus]
MSAAEQEPAKRRMRVVSLLPSATEILALIGAEIVGRSHECDWPETVRGCVPALTGAYNTFENSAQMHDAVSKSLSSGRGLYWLDSELLADLKPDAIVTQSLCAVCAVDLDIVRKAASKIFPPPKIIDTNPMSLQDVIADVRRVGAELGLSQRGEEAAAALQARVDRALRLAASAAAGGTAQAPPKRVVFLEWTSPLFPGGHWTPQMIQMAGGICPINPPREGGGAGPSVETDPSVVVAADPDLVIVAPCGLDLSTTRKEMAALKEQAWWRGLRAVQSGHVVLVDGNQHFNRPGPRLVDALEWLVGLLTNRPDCMPTGFPWELQAATETTEGKLAEAGKAAEEAANNTFTTTVPMDRLARGADPLQHTWPLVPHSAATAVPPPPPPPPPSTPALPTAQSAPERMTFAPNQVAGKESSGRLRPMGHAAAAPSSSLSITPDTMRATPYTPLCVAPDATSTASTAVALPTTITTDAGVMRSDDSSANGQLQQLNNHDSSGGGCSDSRDPWVAACSPWASAPHLPADIEDLHAAACESGKPSYDDPETGFMVFTQLGLAKKGHCCANRCRHCPWGHMRVTHRPRLNRITRPSLLHPTPAAMRAWKQQQSKRHQDHTGRWYPPAREQPSESPGRQTVTTAAAAMATAAAQEDPAAAAQARPSGGGGGGRAGVIRTHWKAVGGTGADGLTLVVHEGCEASDLSVKRVLVEGATRSRGHQQERRVVLLVAFDVDTGALWGSSGVGGGAENDIRDEDGSDGGSGGHSETTTHGPADSVKFNTAQLGAVMETSLRLNMDLVTV